MASTYSTNLAIELIGTGDQAGSWGNTTNTNLGTLIEQAISGYVTQAVATGTDTTITIPNGATGVARNMYIELTGTGGTNTNLIVPANKKLYFIFNNSTGAVTVKVSGQTGVSVPQGKKVVLTSNGTDVVNGLNYIADFGSNSATITQLTATSATITNLTLTSLVISNLSIASANITTLTSTNATAASLTVSTGNLTFSGTAQRITGDMSNATQSNRLSFQSSTTNGNTAVHAIPNGTSQTSAFNVLNNSDPTNASLGQLQITSTEVRINSSITGTGTQLPMIFSVGGERVRIDTSGNVAVGTTNAGTAGVSLNQGYNLSWEQSATESIPNLFRQTSSGALVMSVGYKRSATANGFASSFGSSLAKTAISLGTTAGAITFYTDTAATTAVGTDVTPTERMRINSSGNVGIGTASPGVKLEVSGGNTNIVNANVRVRFANTAGTASTLLFGADSASVFLGAETNAPIYFITNNTERMRLDASGNLLVGTSAAPPSGTKVDIRSGTIRLSTDGNRTETWGINRGDTGSVNGMASIGMFGSGTNGFLGNIVFSTCGTDLFNAALSERMRIDSSGNVGIGTSSPGTKLTVAASGEAGARFLGNGLTSLGLFVGYNSAAYVYNDSNTDMIFGTNATERFRIDAAGNVGIGGAAGANVKCDVKGTLPSSGTLGFSYAAQGTIPSATTLLQVGYYSTHATQAASFTLNQMSHFRAANATVGAGSTITNQHGFIAENLTSATNNYGFYSDIASGSNRWNFYAAGTADNYFAGNVGIGTTNFLYRAEVNDTANSGTGLRIRNESTGASASANLVFGTNIDGQLAYIAVPGGSATDANQLVVANRVNHGIIFRTNNTNRASITAAGNIVAGASAALATTATDGFLYVPTCAGTPTGTPTAITGMAPIVVNTTNNKLYFYSGGAWRDAGP